MKHERPVILSAEAKREGSRHKSYRVMRPSHTPTVRAPGAALSAVWAKGWLLGSERKFISEGTWYR